VLAGNECVGAFVRIVCCCAERLSDGVIDGGTALMIAGRKKILDRLVEVRLMESREGGGYTVHDWHDWQPSAEETAARRSALSEKRALAGKRGAESRWQNGKRDGKAMASAGQPARQTDGPVPVPVPPSDDDDDKAAGAAIASQVADRAPDPRRERNALEVLAQASGGVVSMLASAPDMVAFNDLVTSTALDIDELVAFGEALALRDGAKRIWPSSKARALGQTIPAGWLLGRGGRGRTLLEGIQRWREIKAAETAQPALLGDQTPARAATPTAASFPTAPTTPRTIASNVDEIKHLFRRKGALA
jgi:hypothetical protein